jgi:hypothetical protein
VIVVGNEAEALAGVVKLILAGKSDNSARSPTERQLVSGI